MLPASSLGQCALNIYKTWKYRNCVKNSCQNHTAQQGAIFMHGCKIAPACTEQFMMVLWFCQKWSNCPGLHGAIYDGVMILCKHPVLNRSNRQTPNCTYSWGRVLIFQGLWWIKTVLEIMIVKFGNCCMNLEYISVSLADWNACARVCLQLNTNNIYVMTDTTQNWVC